MKAKYLWLDLETTGLEPNSHCILECAALVTDGKLYQIGEAVSVVLRYLGDGNSPDAFVQEMHTKNGLWKACQNATMPDYNLDIFLGEYLKQFEWEGKPILAGATVHFDRGFLKKRCPYFERELNHRHLDVSSLKLMVVDVKNVPFEKSNAHRALPDIYESLQQARIIYGTFSTSL